MQLIQRTLKCIVGSRQQLCVIPAAATEAVFRAHGHPFFLRAPSSCAVIRADSLWRAFELTSKEKKEILWVPVFSCPPHSPCTHKRTHKHTQRTLISWLYNCHLIQAYTNTWVQACPHTPPDCIIQEMQLYPAPCLTKRVDWTINASMDLGKAFRETEGRLSINSVVTVCESRPGIKAAITQTCCGPKHYDQSRERETPECRNSMAMNEQHFNQVWSYLQGNTTILLFIIVLFDILFKLVSTILTLIII